MQLCAAGRKQAHVSAHGHPPAPRVSEEAAGGEPRALQTAQPHVPPGLAGQ